MWPSKDFGGMSYSLWERIEDIRKTWFGFDTTLPDEPSIGLDSLIFIEDDWKIVGATGYCYLVRKTYEERLNERNDILH